MRILVIEDEIKIAEVISSRLKKEKFIVDIVSNGEEGLDDALTNVYDLIILDVMLPKINGFEILKIIRKERIEAKVIMLTAKSMLEDKLTGFNIGANDYLTKPFHIDELVARVNAQLRINSKEYIEAGDLRLNIKETTLFCTTSNESIEVVCKDNVNIFKYEYINNNNLSYVDELDFNIKTFKEYVKRKMKETLKNYKNNNKLFSEFENDVFIDFSGMKYEWNKKIANNLKNKINKQNYKCIQSERYSSEFNAVKELEKLISSKILVINYDENEPNFGSSILQGIAYYYNKIIIAYETHQVDYYVDGGQHMGVNLMLEQSATKICRDYNELEKVVLEELKKVVKE